MTKMMMMMIALCTILIVTDNASCQVSAFRPGLFGIRR
eukprot:CAMPEP_0119559120 /NCGR_PEP_ID=MMETSP1352-20130426/11909_1 /TAXON_ID=265584 /ORGANISM="Stauroneis constricta, Strain CCMP1120" /LENGTH=37 /DNA_ID= /DNA_START= /DNA_END= /DNA_ORIENTATION=